MHLPSLRAATWPRARSKTCVDKIRNIALGDLKRPFTFFEQTYSKQEMPFLMVVLVVVCDWTLAVGLTVCKPAAAALRAAFAGEAAAFNDLSDIKLELEPFRFTFLVAFDTLSLSAVCNVRLGRRCRPRWWRRRSVDFLVFLRNQHRGITYYVTAAIIRRIRVGIRGILW